MPWWLWVLIGALALAGEAASMALFLLNVGLAAFAAALVAALGLSIALQTGVFIVLSVLLIGAVRPRILRLLVGSTASQSLSPALDSLVGRNATVTEAVGDDDGTIRVGKGEFWSARLDPATRPIGPLDVGSRVRITRVHGLTAYVAPLAIPGTEPDMSTGDSGPKVEAPLPPFGELLKKHRIGANLTQETLAERARLSVRAISDLERGLHRSPQHDTVYLLADALGLTGEDRHAFEAAARRLPDSSPVRRS